MLLIPKGTTHFFKDMLVTYRYMKLRWLLFGFMRSLHMFFLCLLSLFLAL